MEMALQLVGLTREDVERLTAHYKPVAKEKVVKFKSPDNKELDTDVPKILAKGG